MFLFVKAYGVRSKSPSSRVGTEVRGYNVQNVGGRMALAARGGTGNRRSRLSVLLGLCCMQCCMYSLED